jgi:PilZ domain
MSAECQRTEKRIKSKGQFLILMEGGEPVLATVCNISVSGICLEAERGVEPGKAVQLDGNGIVADGVVRHCRFENGLYRIGVALQPPD